MNQIQISATTNPTVNYDQLVFQAGSLNYNLYMLSFQVSMQYNSIYTSQVISYMQVLPSGLVISSINGAIGGGTYETSLGTSQTLTLDPVKYSYDIDSIAIIANLNFSFYCQVIDSGIAYGYPQIYYNSNIDLFTLKNNFSQNANIQQLFNTNNTQHSCFNSIG